MAKILITGGTGMVGSAFKGIKTNHELIRVGSNQCDLRDNKQVANMFTHNSFDGIIHLAAKVGGVKGNSDYVADFFHDNILINANLLNAAKEAKITKVVSLLSTCVYPDAVNYPLTEDQIHNGEPHKSNFGYAYAKRMLEVHSRAIRQQYGYKYVTAVPNNIYGPCDNFDLENGHVVPAIIRKVFEAEIYGTVPKFWGSGKAIREFTYSEDVAKALLWMFDNYDKPEPLNIGCPGDISIYKLVTKIQTLLNASDHSEWDASMPEGQHKKPSSNQNFKNMCPEFEYTPIEKGLEKTLDWFKEAYPNIRGF